MQSHNKNLRERLNVSRKGSSRRIYVQYALNSFSCKQSHSHCHILWLCCISACLNLKDRMRMASSEHMCSLTCVVHVQDESSNPCELTPYQR